MDRDRLDQLDTMMDFFEQEGLPEVKIHDILKKLHFYKGLHFADRDGFPVLKVMEMSIKEFA